MLETITSSILVTSSDGLHLVASLLLPTLKRMSQRGIKALRGCRGWWDTPRNRLTTIWASRDVKAALNAIASAAFQFIWVLVFQ